MSGTVDWGVVEGDVIAVLAITLLLAPMFWWLYDTDRVMKLGNPLLQPMLLVIAIWQATSQANDHDWFLMAVTLGAVGATSWQLYRNYYPKTDNRIG